MNGVPDAGPAEFAGYLSVLRRRWWVVLVLACAGVLAAGAYLVRSPRAYTATATVNVTPVGATTPGQGSAAVAGGRTSGAVNLDTEVQIVQSATVAALAARNLQSAVSPAVLVRNVSVAVPANSSVLQISCRARTAGQSAACANAFAAAYLSNRSATAARTSDAEQRSIQQQLTALDRRTAQLSLRSQVLPAGGPRWASIQAQLQTTASQRRALANQAAALSAQRAASSGGSIISQATAPATPSNPKKEIILPGGLVAGLLIGLVIAFAWDKRDTRVTSSGQLAQAGLPVLLTLSGKDLARGRLAAPGSRAGQDFSDLGRWVTAALAEDHPLVLVAGASPGPAAAVTAANLATALARTHATVFLVGPAGQSPLLGVPKARHFGPSTAAELAAGQLSVADVFLEPAGFPGLRVLLLSEDLHDLPRAHARALAELCRRHADCTIVQAPAGPAGPDSLALAEYCSAALLAVETSTTRRPDIEKATQRITRLGVSVLGLVALPRPGRRRRPDAGQPEIALAAPAQPALARAPMGAGVVDGHRGN
ncbi:MAG TPA: Wzz/FepE/Etk N-terminal domain-containing protein [Streptosporangiaceae bacterium]